MANNSVKTYKKAVASFSRLFANIVFAVSLWKYTKPVLSNSQCGQDKCNDHLSYKVITFGWSAQL